MNSLQKTLNAVAKTCLVHYFVVDEFVFQQSDSSSLELFVLDDGWFGKRDDDRTSLGDWFVDRAKLPNGLENVVNRVRDMDMQFGLWFEPEMISGDSDLYR